jgi:hypothetical protein
VWWDCFLFPWPIGCFDLAHGLPSLGATVVAAASVFLFRTSANMRQLNNDGLPPLSANDWLTPVLTYVLLGVYAALRPPADPAGFASLRAVLTVLSCVVNVVTI